MNSKSTRLFFIDAMRAWAILMMLQGHFIDGLLDPVFRDRENMVFKTWLYFRGITAPVFFTVSGFIFTYLLIRVPQKGFDNPRVKKGIRRGLQLLLIGYLLRTNFVGLLSGHIYGSFYLVDVLHCIGLSILAVIGVYLFAVRRKAFVFPALLLGITLVLFLFEPVYKQWSFGFLPEMLANYFTKANGSVFTIIPWLGYATVGGFLAVLFTKFKDFKYLYPVAISVTAVVGSALIFYSSSGFVSLFRLTGIELFHMIQSNNYLFIRLGDVFLVFAVFMIIRKFLTNPTILKIGASTLSIYVIHFIILYGSFTGMGLYRFFKYSLSPSVVISGALVFMVVCTYLALLYNKRESEIKEHFTLALDYSKLKAGELKLILSPIARDLSLRAKAAWRRFSRIRQ
ncbi:heparan-alpha-glucosaminide N-acetyltransferase domain-containing protein [Flagellimonas flava]|uniref:heparan-alpha-glucosaminide N-acetyltransferase domain-containing protein n=1 Tax=Flagellimonas flava TaxID=570519 RepID=UPI003D650E0E